MPYPYRFLFTDFTVAADYETRKTWVICGLSELVFWLGHILRPHMAKQAGMKNGSPLPTRL
jgi:hypothetical protein